MKINKIIIALLFISLHVSYIFSQTENSAIENPIEYFNQRNEAISLVKNEQWQEASLKLENLIGQYQNDADLYYLLGISYYQVKQYQNSIAALKKALEFGGTILRGIPTGSAPSNDIMIKIAKAYAKDGDKNNAILWLQKGFAARYDEKPFLEGDAAFNDFNKDFKKLFGKDNLENITRNEAWTRDIGYLEKRINELHYSPNHAISKGDFSKKIQDIKASVASLSDEEIVVELIKVVGSLGNGHNLIIPTSPKKGALKKLPVQFYQFNDGIFIVDAEEDLKQWIGYTKLDSYFKVMYYKSINLKEYMSWPSLKDQEEHSHLNSNISLSSFIKMVSANVTLPRNMMLAIQLLISGSNKREIVVPSKKKII